MKILRKSVGATLVVMAVFTSASAQRLRPARPAPAIPVNTLLQIVRAEDQRSWDNDLATFLNDKDAIVRKRAALAAGRIGDERAIPNLTELLRDLNPEVRQMAAFALGEIESPIGADFLIVRVEDRQEFDEVRARAVEALGKIGATLVPSTPAASTQGAPAKPEDPRLTKIKAAILDALKFEAERRSGPDRYMILFGLTAVLRTRPAGAGDVVVRFLSYSDPRIVADALNTMARLRLKDNNDAVRKLLKHNDPVVRANAARVLGAAEDKGGFDALLDLALHDADARVRVSAIRSLGSLKDGRAADPLLDRGKVLVGKDSWKRASHASGLNECFEIATVIGTLLKNAKSEKAIWWLRSLRGAVSARSPEVEVAMARIDPELYVTEEMRFGVGSPATIAQGLTEIATIRKTQPTVESASKFVPSWMSDLLMCRFLPAGPGVQLPTGRKCLLDPSSLPPFLRAYAAFKPDDLDSVLRQRLKDEDVVVRGTAADLLGELPPDESNANALIEALPVALRDKDINDAALSILDALAKQKTTSANEAIKTALSSSDQLVRKRAVAHLKENGAGDFSDRIGPAETRNREADYRRAIARIGRQVRATLVTSKGEFTIEFIPGEAPLTVDNFVQLARRGYFNGVTFHRVVANFVIQGGDPRGDGNGGPGYSIRCEVNEVPYDRAVLGMALSGKDTGGSQWFVTHSPQPHLDGGYTVFGRVVSGMDVVDGIVRGDTIRRVIVSERLR